MRFAVRRRASATPLLGAAACAIFAARSARAQEPPAAPAAQSAPNLAVQVNGAIDRGVAFLKTQQNKDGTFRCPHWCPIGTTALTTYALLKSGVAPSEPVVAKALDFLHYQPFQWTYETTVMICAFDALGSKSEDRVIVAGGEWLEKHQREDGLWAYPDKADDLSNSQYAALGMWVAERHGFKAKRETWGKLLKEVVRRQNADGGFGYHEGDVSSGSMTTAGVAVLLLASERVAGDERYGTLREKAKTALPRGWKWLEQFFTVEGNPKGDRTVVPEASLYYLFGIERIGAIGDKKQIGSHDWYPEGARHLCRVQANEGAWHDCDGTSFALLFLRRATFTGMHHDGGDAEAKPAVVEGPQQPHAAAPFLRRWFVCGPLPDPKHDQLEAPYAGEATVEPSVGAAFRGRPWVERRQLRDFVEFADGSSAKTTDATISYAFTWLHVAADVDTVIWFGSDDGGRLLVDGKTVFTRHVHGGAARDRSAVPVKLAAGVHSLLVKVDNATGPSGFFLRVANPDGSIARDVTPSLSKSDPELSATALAMPELFKPRQLRELLPLLPKLDVDFKSAKDLELFAFQHVDGEKQPRWIDEPKPAPENPAPGARGILVVHPLAEKWPARIWFRAKVPTAPSRLVVRVTEEAYGGPGKSDFVLRVGAFVDELEWLYETTVGPDPAPDPKNWRTIEVPLDRQLGADTLFVVEVAGGGTVPWWYEHAFFDEIAIR